MYGFVIARACCRIYKIKYITYKNFYDGCIMSKKLNLKNNHIELLDKRFGRLTVIKFMETKSSGVSIWECECDCGNVTQTSIGNLKSGNTKSCGCLQREVLEKGRHKHGFYKKKQFYRVWINIKTRCNNKKFIGYKDYGARGIGYTSKWETFEGFKEDMYQSYVFAKKKYRKVINNKNPLSIERKDFNGNYCKENCIWLPLNEQQRNTRRNKWFEAVDLKNNRKYKSNSQINFAKKHNLTAQLINQCLRGRRKTHKDWKFEYMS